MIDSLIEACQEEKVEEVEDYFSRRGFYLVDKKYENITPFNCLVFLPNNRIVTAQSKSAAAFLLSTPSDIWNDQIYAKGITELTARGTFRAEGNKFSCKYKQTGAEAFGLIGTDGNANMMFDNGIVTTYYFEI